MISEETKAYYDLKKRNDVRESAKRIRRQFLRYIVPLKYLCKEKMRRWIIQL